jgi:ABC-type nitrate/sulfonate/bicarbonate transport system permease component
MVVTLATPILVIAVASGLRKDFLEKDLYLWLGIHRQKVPFWVRALSLIWALLPGVLAGVKSAISLGLVMVIVSEMLFVANSGVGYAAYQAYNAFQIPEMYGYVVVTGFVGFGLNALFDYAIKLAFAGERRFGILPAKARNNASRSLSTQPRPPS